MGASAPLRSVKKIFRPNLQKKMCKCTPLDTLPARARVNFRTVFAGWLRLEVYLDGL